MVKRFGILALILEGLAERKLDVGAIGIARRTEREQPLHGGHVGRRESVGLEIRQTPVGLSHRRLDEQRLAVRLDGPGRVAHVAQLVALHQTQGGIMRMVGNGPFQQGDGFGVAAIEAQRLHLEANIVGIARVGVQQASQMLIVALMPAQFAGQIPARRCIAWRDLQGTPQMLLRGHEILAQERRPGEHPQRRDVIGHRVQAAPQQAEGWLEASIG